MPCRSDPDYPDYNLMKKLDAITRMTCGLLRRIEKLQAQGVRNADTLPERVAELISDDTGLAEWWENHKELDAQRLKDEQARKRERKLRKEALAKLTPEERKLLGLKR